jgi:hypothetical protein
VDEEYSPEERRVTGSVVEFAFGDSPQSYLATSYPYRVEFAEKSDIRTLARYGPGEDVRHRHQYHTDCSNIKIDPMCLMWSRNLPRSSHVTS